jgi:hypothetical protein
LKPEKAYTSEKGSIKKWTIQRHWKFWTPDTERRQIKHNTENYKKNPGVIPDAPEV